MLDAAVVMRFRAGRTPLRVRAEATILGHGDAGRATARPKVLRIILGLQLAKLAAQNSVFVPKSERNFLLALCTLTLSALGRARRHAAGSPIGMAIRRRGVAAGPRGRVRRFRIRIRAAHARCAVGRWGSDRRRPTPARRLARPRGRRARRDPRRTTRPVRVEGRQQVHARHHRGFWTCPVAARAPTVWTLSLLSLSLSQCISLCLSPSRPLRHRGSEIRARANRRAQTR